jgi:hypothetical protein
MPPRHFMKLIPHPSPSSFPPFIAQDPLTISALRRAYLSCRYAIIDYRAFYAILEDAARRAFLM